MSSVLKAGGGRPRRCGSLATLVVGVGAAAARAAPRIGASTRLLKASRAGISKYSFFALLFGRGMIHMRRFWADRS